MDGCANCGNQFKIKAQGYRRASMDSIMLTGSNFQRVTPREALEKMTGLSFVTFGKHQREGEFLCSDCLTLLKSGYRCHCAMNEFWRVTSQHSYVMHCLSKEFLVELQSSADFAAGITRPTLVNPPKQDAEMDSYAQSFLTKKTKTSKLGTISVCVKNRHYASAVRGIYRATAGSKRQFLNVVKKEVRREVQSLLLSDICLCQKASLVSTPEDIQWNEVIEELRDKAPLLHTVLTGAGSTRKNEHDLRRGQNRRVDLKPKIGTALAILLYAKSPVRASYLPTIISLILKRKKSKQKTLKQLSKLGLCFSPNGAWVCFRKLRDELHTAKSNNSSRAEEVTNGEEDETLAHSRTINNTKDKSVEPVHDPKSVEDTSPNSLDSENDAEETILVSSHFGDTESNVNIALEGEEDPHIDTDVSETDISSVDDEIYSDDDQPYMENYHSSDKILVDVPTEESPGTEQDFEQPVEESLHPGFTLSWDHVCNQMTVSHPHVAQQNAKEKYSLGYLAVNRVSTVHLDNSEGTTISASRIPLSVFTPSVGDFHELQSRMTVIVSRILTRHLKWFREFFDDCTVEHISHAHSVESVQRSLLMNLGAVDECSADGNTEVVNIVGKCIAKGTDHAEPSVLFRNSSDLGCVSQDNGLIRYKALISDAQEFRKEIVLLEDYYRDFLSESSSAEKGTLCHTMNMIDSAGDKLESFSQRWDLMCEATEALVILAAMQIMGLKKISGRPPSAVKGLEASSVKRRRSFLDAVSKQVVQSVWHEMDTDALTVSQSKDGVGFCCNEDRDEGVVRCKSGKGCIKGEVFHYSCAGVTLHNHPDEWHCSEECERKSKKPFKYCMCSRDLGDVAMVGCEAQQHCLLKEWYHLDCIGFSEQELPSSNWYCTEKCKQLFEDESAGSSRPAKKRRTNTKYLPDYKFRYNTALVWRGLNLLCRRDAVREGDGDAMMSYWVMDLVDFYRTNKFESVTSAHRLLSSVKGWLPEKIRHDLRWNRTVNFTGGSGRNLPADLMNDILNQILNGLPKNQRDYFVSKISANANPSLSLGNESVDVVFDPKMIQREVKLYTRRNADIDKNVRMIVDSLTGEDLFKFIPGRQYETFSTFKYEVTPKHPGKFGPKLAQLARRLDSKQLVKGPHRTHCNIDGSD